MQIVSHPVEIQSYSLFDEKLVLPQFAYSFQYSWSINTCYLNQLLYLSGSLMS